MDLLIIRHGLPMRIEGADGPADPPLAEFGHAQARAMAAFLAGERIDAIYASPMARARETAMPLAETLGLPITIDDDIAEFDRHADSYVPIEELKAEGDPRWLEMLAGGYFEEGDQTPAEFQSVVVSAIDRIVDAHTSQRVAVVCHGGVMLAYTGHVLGIEDFMFTQPTYTGITRIQASSRGHRTLQSFNETAHLRGLER